MRMDQPGRVPILNRLLFPRRFSLVCASPPPKLSGFRFSILTLCFLRFLSQLLLLLSSSSILLFSLSIFQFLSQPSPLSVRFFSFSASTPLSLTFSPLFSVLFCSPFLSPPESQECLLLSIFPSQSFVRTLPSFYPLTSL
ncbi:hypothetical protein L6164_023470 [Bauhinia variegata]|uniref:Uncharacterized protein n=1 Tax=Bauhinia variegata TaxID=167791 RepID=A0ACB9MLP5_BAUVA|nr:hypothetical protein L6164_023470 [Bauhinia variegata]